MEVEIFLVPILEIITHGVRVPGSKAQVGVLLHGDADKIVDWSVRKAAGEDIWKRDSG